MVIIRRFDPIEYDRAVHHGLPRIDAHIRYQQQNGLCAICQLPTKDDKPLQVDHDHTHCDRATGCRDCVRGFLCAQCNSRVALVERILRFDPAPYLAYIETWRDWFSENRISAHRRRG